jgi:phenylacetate-CoA ligase
MYNSSGTTGHPIYVLSHPETSSTYLPLTEAALARHGVTLEGGNRVSLLMVCAQASTFTFGVVSAYLRGAGFLKINLNPAEWRDPDDRMRFIDACDAEVFTGDPVSFAEAMKLPLATRPKALVSTALALADGLRLELERHFRCPVIDLYSMNESGTIAVAVDSPDGRRRHEVLPHDLYVEILDESGAPCPPGVRGEVTLTGGRNPFLPLLRYRTGDQGAMEFDGDTPLLIGLEGRPPTLFRAPDGRTVNNIDVTLALHPFALSQFTLHQFADGSLRLCIRGQFLNQQAIRQAVLGVFGPSQALAIEEIPQREAWSGKIIQYTRDPD